MKTYFHIIEECIVSGLVGYQGFTTSETEAEKIIDRLQKTFDDDDLFFWIYQSESKSEPPIITI